MVYIMNQKFFVKHIVEMAKYPYFAFDGENYGISSSKYGGDSGALASRYDRMYTLGSFTPEVRLFDMLKKMKKGEEINPRKYENEVDAFINDKAFIAACACAIKALTYSQERMNIFVILPNIVYKYLGKTIQKKMIKLCKKHVDFEFVYTQNVLEDDMKRLKNQLNDDQIKKIVKAVKRIEKKYDLEQDPNDEYPSED